MPENLTAGNPATTTTGNPSTDPAAANGTSNQTGEAAQTQGATGSETFIPQGLDLNTLPQSVRAHIEKINADMVRGFTEKTTKLSETIKTETQKATEAYKQKAEFYDQISTQDEFVRMWNEYVQKTGTAPTGADPNDPVSELKSQVQAMQQKVAASEMKQVTDAFAEAKNEKGELLNPHFDELNSLIIGKHGEGDTAQEYSLLRAAIELAPGKTPQEKLANGYKAAKQLHDAIFEAGKKAGMGRLQAKVLNGTNPPSGSNGDMLSVTEKKPKSAREALEMARKGVMVSRD